MVKQHYRDNSYYSYHPNSSSPRVSFQLLSPALSLFLTLFICLLAHSPSPTSSLSSSLFILHLFFLKDKKFSTPVWGIGSIHPQTSCQHPWPLGWTIKLHMGVLRLVPPCVPLDLSSSASTSLSVSLTLWYCLHLSAFLSFIYVCTVSLINTFTSSSLFSPLVWASPMLLHPSAVVCLSKDLPASHRRKMPISAWTQDTLAVSCCVYVLNMTLF